MLEASADMEIVAEAGTGETGLRAFAQHRPDVVVMDLRLPDLSGREAAVAMSRGGRAPILMLTSRGQDTEVQAAFEAGVHSLLRKDFGRPELLEAVRTVANGGSHIPDDVRERLGEAAPLPALTRREMEVLRSMAQGMTNRQIGAALSISDDTVKLHVKHLFRKLHVDDRTEAVAVAARRGILQLE
jgi:two-component system NarL family response regulator